MKVNLKYVFIGTELMDLEGKTCISDQVISRNCDFQNTPEKACYAKTCETTKLNNFFSKCFVYQCTLEIKNTKTLSHAQLGFLDLEYLNANKNEDSFVL